MLAYFLWDEHWDDGKGLVRYFVVEDGKATEAQHWFRGQDDITHGVITHHQGKRKIFFNEHLQGTIYTTAYGQDDYCEFYKFPDTMKIVDMICE